MSGAELFGTTSDGEAVHRVSIAAGNLRASIIGWGAALQDLRLAGHDAPLVLGYPTFDDYPAFSPHFGAVPGRFANRIRGDFRSIGVSLYPSGIHTFVTQGVPSACPIAAPISRQTIPC